MKYKMVSREKDSENSVDNPRAACAGEGPNLQSTILWHDKNRLVEVSGMEHRIVFQKRPHVTIEDMVQAFKSKRAEQRAGVLRLEVDYELAVLHEALAEGRAAEAEASKRRLEAMRIEMIQLEM